MKVHYDRGLMYDGRVDPNSTSCGLFLFKLKAPITDDLERVTCFRCNRRILKVAEKMVKEAERELRKAAKPT